MLLYSRVNYLSLSMNILFLSRWFPYPVNNGSKLRIYNLLHGLAKHHELTLLSFTDQPNTNLVSPALQSLCEGIKVAPWQEFDPHSRRARFGFFGLKPRFIVNTYSSSMENLIETSVSSKKFDLVIASQLSMAAYCHCFRDIPAIFDEIELGIYHPRMSITGVDIKYLRHTLTWLKLKKYLSHILNFFHAFTVVSEWEHHLLVDNLPKFSTKINVIPNCINYDDYQELDVRQVPNQLIFTGSFRFQANYEAMKWFVEEIFPKILMQLPETQLVITGDHVDLPFPSAHNIKLVGYIDDIKSMVASSRVSIAPLLSGGGTRLKILEAMAIGVPVVATSKGAEGLNAVSGEHLLVVDSPDEFADAVVAVLKDYHLSEKLSANGKLLVKEKYDWQSVLPRFLKLVEDVGSS